MNARVHYTLIRFIQIRFSRPLVEAGDNDLVTVLSTQVMAFLLHMTLRLGWIRVQFVFLVVLIILVLVSLPEFVHEVSLA